MSQSLVILLHGVGADGADLAPLGGQWRKALPQTAFVAPDAPFPSGYGFGRQWFSLEGITPANRAVRIAEARAPFDTLLQEIIAAHGLGDHPERVALVGFSQGSMMALDALVSGRRAFGAIVAFSGRLVSDPAPGLSLVTPTLLIHGAEDPVIAASESVEAAAILQKLGVETQLLVLPALGHGISQEGAAMAQDFLARRFAPQGAA